MKFKQPHFWYEKHIKWWVYLLLPFSWLFSISITIRRYLYRYGILKTTHFSVPIIVVGNITVGGTGKTPFVIWLANFLRTQGYVPGIVSRGMGEKKYHQPHRVQSTDSVNEVGDEAFLLIENTHCPLVIGRNRAAAVAYLLKHTDCNIVISDDGLQHLALGRDIEIAIVDGERRWGNGCLLPAGPLRESPKRLQSVDKVIIHGNPDPMLSMMNMQLIPLGLISVKDPQQKKSFAEFPIRHVHAVAGIGHPQRFFTMLNALGFMIKTHVFPDHHLFQAQDLVWTPSLPIFMTEKDAVKCREFAKPHYWYVQVETKVHQAVGVAIIEILKKRSAPHDD